MYIHQQNYAAFGQVNYQITPDLKIFAGGRVTHDDNTDFSFNNFPAGPFIYTGDTGFFSVFPVNSCTVAGGNPYIVPAIPCPAGTSINTPATLRKTGLSGKVGLQYQLDEDAMIYASIARGYKGPFMNESVSYIPTNIVQPLTIGSEYPTDIELGVKTTVWDRFVLDVGLFTDNIKNFQTTIYVPAGPGHIAANFIQGNAPYAISRGVEASFFGNITDNLAINANAIWNDAHFGKGFLVSCVNPPTNTCPAVDQLPFAPAWKATFAADYHHNLFNSIEGFIQGDLAYSGVYPYSSTPGLRSSPPRYQIGARAGIRPEESQWDLAVFCRNCLDKRYPIRLSPDGFAANDGAAVPAGVTPVGPGVPAHQFLTIDSYRVVGVTLDFKY
jgi:iron complex outermembrane receptor protein